MYKLEDEESDKETPQTHDEETQHFNSDNSANSTANASFLSQNSSFSFQARRCLFKASPTPASSAHSTPKLGCLGDATNSYRQITPVSTHRPNVILSHETALAESAENDDEAMSTLFDYSMNSIERSLEIFAAKRREREIPTANTKNILGRINEIECENEYKEHAETRYFIHELIEHSLKFIKSPKNRKNVSFP